MLIISEELARGSLVSPFDLQAATGKVLSAEIATGKSRDSVIGKILENLQA